MKGWAGNQTVAYEAEKLAKQRGKGKDAAGKDSIYWKWAENDLIRKARNGGAAGLLEGNTGQLWTQFIGVGFTIIYTGVLTYIILKIVSLMLA